MIVIYLIIVSIYIVYYTVFGEWTRTRCSSAVVRSEDERSAYRASSCASVCLRDRDVSATGEVWRRYDDASADYNAARRIATTVYYI